MGRCLAVGLLLTGLAVFSSAAQPPEPKPIKVFAGILPVAGFVERIGGEYVQVSVLIGPGQSPHTFEPTPRAMADLAEARLYFSADLPFEEQLLAKVTATRPDLKVIDTRAGVTLRHLTADEAEAHEEGHEEEHAEGHAHEHEHAAGEPDPHFWLDPHNAKMLATHVAAGLADADPAHAEVYRERLRGVLEDLDRLDGALRKALEPLKGQVFLVFHPAFGYFGDAYGLKQAAVEIEGKEPGARQLADLIDRARQLGVRVVFVQPQFSKKSAEAIARTIGGTVVEMDPLGRDYTANLRDMAAKVREALAPAAADGTAKER